MTQNEFMEPGADRTLDRRTMIRLALHAAGAVALGAACAPSRMATTAAVVPSVRRFAKVRVAANRVVRSVAGLRPFRPSGFVVRAERLGERTVVHNYGHGGAGITLSWGSSAMAVELATATLQRRFAVIGCGVMGLTTARLLQDRGFEATIYAKELPPDTTSNIAGAQWSPYTVSDPDATTPAFRARLERAARLSHRHFQHLIGDTYGVRWIENYILLREPPPPPQSPIADLFFDNVVLSRDQHPFAAPYARRFTTMLIEPNVLLGALTRDFLLRGGKIHVREFREPRDLMPLDEPVIVNCTGLGSHALFGDSELVPVKGQLAILLPQPEVDYIAIQGDYYMFPRSDGIVLGGTRERGEWSSEVDPAVTARIIEGHRGIFEAMA